LKRYEGMFLFDNTTVHEWPEMEAEVRRLFERIQAEPLVCVKFDERKLAYEIKGCKRGTYVLTYFNADPQSIANLERDARLSELVLRTIVLCADKLSDERLAELQGHPADQPLQPISSDGRRGEGGPRTRSETPDKPEAKAEDESETEAAKPVATRTALEDDPKLTPKSTSELPEEIPPAERAFRDGPADI
jgi:small subunit ribosomal protein S6